MRYQFLGLSGLGMLWTLLTLAQTGLAQTGAQTVIPDNTAGTVVGGAGPFTITGGTQRLTTLFHSFTEFSPGTANTLFQLNNGQNAVNVVVGRVTGRNDSFIDGQLALTGGNTPDLFLINPNGIRIGANASLLLPGSFLASTAESILFQNNLEFSATSPGAVPLLNVNVPIGLQFGLQNGASPAPVTIFNANLAVNPQQTLSFTGGEIILTNGTLNAEQGRVELGSVTSPGRVSLKSVNDGVTLGYREINRFGDLSLTQNSVIDVSGDGAGNIHLQGETISILDDSFLAADTLKAQDGGSIVLNASEAVRFFDTDTSSSLLTNGLFSQVLNGAAGRGADVTINADLVSLANEAQIFLNTSGRGETGKVTLTANALTLADSSNIFVLIESGATGNGGDIDIDVERLEQRDASQIGSGTFGDGNGSNIFVKAISIDASGETADGRFTSLITSVVLPGSTGNAGDISVETDELRFREGAQLFSGTFGEGNAGALNVKANSIDLIGESLMFGFPSGFLASANQAIPDVTVNAGQGELRGASGNIKVEAGTLRLRQGGVISSSTSGFGDAANITIQATRLDVSGVSANGFDGSRISASSHSVGNAGAIAIAANEVTVTDRGTIAVSSADTGDAGSLTIVAERIRLDSRGSLQADLIAGDQGSITLTASQLLLLRNGSNISTNATGNARGGDITIISPVIVGLENSDIVANSVQDMGGNITITTQGILGLEFRERLTPGNDITASSQFGVNGRVEINSVGIDPDADLGELPVGLVDASDQIAQGCSATGRNELIATGRGGVPTNPIQDVNSNHLWTDIRDLSAFLDSAAPISLVAPTTDILVEATAWQATATGQVELIATNSVSSGHQVHGMCSVPKALVSE